MYDDGKYIRLGGKELLLRSKSADENTTFYLELNIPMIDLIIKLIQLVGNDETMIRSVCLVSYNDLTELNGLRLSNIINSPSFVYREIRYFPNFI